MRLRQISVFVENRKGRLYHISKIIADAGVDLRALCVADTQDFGILRCVVSDVDAACAALEEARVAFSVTEVLGVEVSDVPGGLEGLLQILCNAGTHVEYLYSFAGAGRGAVIIFHVDDMEAAEELLRQSGVETITEKSL